MRKLLVAALPLVVLAGCTKTVEEMSYSERQVLAQQIVQRCVAQGVKPETPQMQECTGVEAQREVASRRRAAARQDAIAANRTRANCQVFGAQVVCF